MDLDIVFFIVAVFCTIIFAFYVYSANSMHTELKDINKWLDKYNVRLTPSTKRNWLGFETIISSSIGYTVEHEPASLYDFLNEQRKKEPYWPRVTKERIDKVFMSPENFKKAHPAHESKLQTSKWVRE